jgi:hypothetical protein
MVNYEFDFLNKLYWWLFTNIWPEKSSCKSLLLNAGGKQKMKKTTLIIYFVGIMSLIISTLTPSLLFASSCHGGGGGSRQRSSPRRHQTREKREPLPVKVIEVKYPPFMTIKGIMASPGEYLHKNLKGYWHDEKKYKNTAILVKKVEECSRSGEEDCPFENKLYHILSDKNSKKLIKDKKYKDAKVSIKARFYPDERVISILSYSLLNEEEIKEMESHEKLLSDQEKHPSHEKPIYKCPMHPEVTSDNPGDCLKCGMKLELSAEKP